MSKKKLKDIEVKDAEVIKVLEDTDAKPEMTQEELYARFEEMLASGKATGFINQPYKVILNEVGEVANPIVKGKPYRNPFPNRKARRRMLRSERPKTHNGKTFPTMIKRVDNDFLRYSVVRQLISANTTVVYDGLNKIGTKFHPSRTIVHYRLRTKFN